MKQLIERIHKLTEKGDIKWTRVNHVDYHITLKTPDIYGGHCTPTFQSAELDITWSGGQEDAKLLARIYVLNRWEDTDKAYTKRHVLSFQSKEVTDLYFTVCQMYNDNHYGAGKVALGFILTDMEKRNGFNSEQYAESPTPAFASRSE